jgi:hypothetical protein
MFTCDVPTDYQPELGELVYFWTGRGSQGYALVREIRNGRYYLDPHPTATKGSDYRRLRNGKRFDYWFPRDSGVPIEQLTQPPRIWYENS